MKLAAAKELSENKLNAFQARMNPHFIFNALSSIQSLIMDNENERSIDYLSEFSTLMRQVLDNSLKSKVLLRTEINMLRSYIELENLRFECFQWDIEVKDNVDPDDVEIPGMIVQPFVENSILHGLIPRGENGRLTVTFERVGSHITCVVDDNGIGREASAVLNKSRNKSRQSHGISIATNRLALLNDKRRKLINTVVYTDKQEQGIATGTRVTIQLPIL
jgi:sensor histidine kinase YesM